MEQPIQVGLVFPRSGQQVTVTVPATAVEYVRQPYFDRSAVRVSSNSPTAAMQSSADSKKRA